MFYFVQEECGRSVGESASGVGDSEERRFFAG